MAEMEGKNVHVVVCEDEKEHSEQICKFINRWKEKIPYPIKITKFTSAQDFIKAWENEMVVDALFMDIVFQDAMTGMEAAKIVREKDMRMMIVFTTNSNEHIKQGYSVMAFRYLTKPVLYEEIELCLKVAYNQYTLRHNEFLILSESMGRLVLRFDEIIYIEAQAPYIYIFMEKSEKPLKLRYRFRDFSRKLPEELFVLCHRSYMVNVMHVRRITNKEVLLSSKRELPVSRTHFEILRRVFDCYYQEGDSGNVFFSL